MVFAQLETTWESLSDRHQVLDHHVRKLIDEYVQGSLARKSYAVLGTFGAGKTQFLFNVFNAALSRGLVPLYFLAEDLFSEAIRGDEVTTPGDLDALVNRKLEKAVTLLQQNETYEELQTLLDPRGRTSNIVERLIEGLSNEAPAIERVVLLVDELEGQYKSLQEAVQTNDRSPLREFLQAPYLTFLALAPAGMYELGNADQTRTIRLVIPPLCRSAS